MQVGVYRKAATDDTTNKYPSQYRKEIANIHSHNCKHPK